MKKDSHDNDTIFVPEDQEERDLLAALVRKHIPERYNTLADEPKYTKDTVELEWPDHIKFGLILTRALMGSLYGVDQPIEEFLMGLYFRAYVTTDPERRIDIKLFVEDNKQKHLEALCDNVNKRLTDSTPVVGPRPGAWTTELALRFPNLFMWSVAEALDEDPKQRMEWLVI